MPAPSRPPTFGVVLAAVGGYLDALGFLMLDGLFVNHVTGNIVLAAAEPGRSSVPEIVMFPVFFVMVAFGTLIAAKAERRRPSTGIAVALAAEAAFFVLFLVLGLIWFPQPHASGLLAELAVGAAGVSGMAIQTAVTRLAGYQFPTNMVTGTMTMLGMDAGRLAFRLSAGAEERAATATRARDHAHVVAGFAFGAVAGAVATHQVHFWAAIVPVAVIAVAARQRLHATALQRRSLQLVP